MAQQPQLESVVQKMIDAGEPEENIATVIQHYKSQAITTPTAEDMLTRRVGADFSETPAKQDWKAPLNDALSAMAHPQSVGDLGNYFIPAALPATVGRLVSPVARGVAKYGGAVVEAGLGLLPEKAQTAIKVLGQLKPSEWHSPLTVGGRDARSAEAARAFNERPLATQMNDLPTGSPPSRSNVVVQPAAGKMSEVRGAGPYDAPAIRGRMIEPPPRNLGQETQPAPLQTSAPTAPSALSPTDRASLQKQGYPPELIARIEQRLTQGEVVRSTPSRDVSPLREPRINIGAQRVGRQEGLTKEAVRQTTGPVLDEGLGEASPIFPKAALTRIVDDMRALPPGAEREAYVARATSGKAKWQVENIRRTLEHLGLLLPLAVRARIMQQQMRGDASTGAQ